ncbi:MAG: hypothetical protein ACYTEQ_30265 [Planctomycetota bacterium]
MTREEIHDLIVRYRNEGSEALARSYEELYHTTRTWRETRPGWWTSEERR